MTSINFCYRNNGLQALLIALVAVLPFLSSLSNGFVLDDLIHVTSNPQIRTLSSSFAAFGEPMFPGSLYRPLVTFSYGLTYFLFGFTELPYHLLNIILHAAVSFLLFLILKQIASERVGLVASLLFAVHPLHSEVVANVSGRAELLCHVFGLLASFVSLRAFREAKASRLFLVFLFAFAALLSKESGAVYVLLYVLLVGFAYGMKSLRSNESIRVVFAFLLALVGYLVLRFIVLGSLMGALSSTSFVDNPLVELPWFSRAYNAILLLGRYISLCLIPHPLSADYSFAHLGPVTSLFDKGNLPEISVLLFFFLLTGYGIYKRTLLSLAGLWFLVAFCITSNVLFPIGTIFAERLAYLPSFGICLIIAFFIVKLSRTIQVVVVAVFLLAGGYFSFQTAKKWQSQESLFSYQIHISPKSVKTLVNYSVILRNKGQGDAALRYLGKAFEMYPDYPEISLGMGAVWIGKGNLPQAEFWLRRCLDLNPSHVEALNLLGRVLLNQNRNEEARRLLSFAREIDPQHVKSGVALLAACINLKDIACAGQVGDELAPLASDDPEYKKLVELMRGK